MFASNPLQTLLDRAGIRQNRIRRSRAGAAQRQRRQARRTSFEALEDRNLLATVTGSDSFIYESLLDGPSNNGQFTIDLGAPAAAATTFDYALTGTATYSADGSQDYTSEINSGPTGLTGSVTFSIGEQAITVDVDVHVDGLYDGDELGNDETVTFELYPSGSAVLEDSATIAIVDHESAPSLSITASDPNAGEPGNNGEFTVSLSGPSDIDTTVAVSYSGTAVNGQDYNGPSSVVIPAKATTGTATLAVVNDTLVELTESVVAALGSNTGNYNITNGSPSSATADITDNDGATISLATIDGSAGEPSDDGSLALTMTRPASTDTVVRFSVTGDAAEGTDYTLGMLSEIESNDTAIGPQNGTGAQGLAGFSLANNPAIEDSTTRPHVTISSTTATNDGSVDIYAFYVANAGAVGKFDIDNPSNLNSELRLYDSPTGAPLAISDPGDSNESSIQHTFSGAGVYYIAVRASGATGPVASASYQLHVSVDGASEYGVIGAGSTQTMLPVTVIDDSIVEPTEVLDVEILSKVAGDAQIGLSTTTGALEGQVSIADDDSATLTIDGTTNGFEPSTDGLFTVTQSFISSTDTVIPFTVSGTAKKSPSGTDSTPWNPVDHSLVNGSVVIPAGSTSVTIPVPVIDSDLIEENETVIVTLGAPTDTTNGGITLGTPASDQILIGDDDRGVVNLNASINVALEGATNGEFTFSLAKPPGFPLPDPIAADRETVINYTVSGDATSASDFAALTGTVTIPAFQSSFSIPVTVIDDLLLENPETVTITMDTLSTPTDSNIEIGVGSPTDTVTIIDNDSVTAVVLPGGDGAEPDSDGWFSVMLTGSVTTLTATTVTYTVTGGTAVQSADYATVSGSVVIPAGATTGVIPIDVLDDLLFEGTESVEIALTGATGGPGLGYSTVPATISISDNEAGDVTLIASDPTAQEAEGNGEFTITLGGQSPTPTVVSYTVRAASEAFPNEATPGSDYVALSGTVTFQPFETVKHILVDVINDSVFEDSSELVSVALGSILSGIGYTIGAPDAAQVTILRDQQISVAPATTPGSESGPNPTFIVSIDSASDTDTVVTYSLTGLNTAISGDDYDPLLGSVVIPAHTTSAVVTVPVIDDSKIEDTESVSIRLTGISSGDSDIRLAGANSNSSERNATVAITDNDAAYVTVAATVPKAYDVPGSAVDGEFTVSMSAPSDWDTVVSYDVLVSSTADPGVDYVTLSETVTIPAGSTSAAISVEVIEDALVEGDETVTMELTGIISDPAYPGPGVYPVYLGAIGSTNGVLTFLQGLDGYGSTFDTTLSQDPGSVNHGNSINLQVDTDVLSPSPSFAQYQSLVKLEDLFGMGAGMIPAGSAISSAELRLKLEDSGAGDSVRLHQMLGAWSEGVITWDNAMFAGNTAPGIQADNVEAKSAGTLAAASGVASLFDVTAAVSAWSGGAANYGWVLLPTGLDDVWYRSSEHPLQSQRPELEIALDLTATVTICDTDTALVNVIGTEDAAEPGTPGLEGAIQIGMTAASSTDTVIAYTVTGGTALSGSDFVPLPGTVTIPAGDTMAEIVIVPRDDSLLESVENVEITLTGITSGDPKISLGGNLVGETDILDNEVGLVTIAASDSTAAEPANDGLFTVSISSASDVETRVAYTIGGTATNGSDYAALSGVATIPAYFLTTTISVDVTDDNVNEALFETVIVTLTTIVSGNDGTAIANPSSDTVRIEDDDQPLTVTVEATDAIATEGQPNDDGELTISLNHPSDQPTTVTFQVSGTATVTGSAQDYAHLQYTTAASGHTIGEVTIPAGSTTVILAVDPIQDFVKESPPDETVVITVTGATNLNGNPAIGSTDTVEIVDESFDVTVTKTDSPAAEPGPPVGNNGQFTVAIANPMPVDTLVDFTITGTAKPKIDFDMDGLYDAIDDDPDANQLWVGTATITAGATFTVVDVDVLDDLLIEGNETVFIELTGVRAPGDGGIYNPLPELGTPITAQETIADDDSALLSITSTQDGQEPGGLVNDGRFVISQSHLTTTDTVVVYQVLAGSTATPGSDYVALSGTAIIPAGSFSTTVPKVQVDVVDDLIVEPTESVIVKLDSITSGNSAVSIGPIDTATVLIEDNDTTTVSILATDNLGVEPGANDGTFTVFLSKVSSTPTVVSYQVGGDATAGSDYTALSGSVTIPAMAGSASILVDVLDDMIVEDDELVIVTLDSVSGGSQFGLGAMTSDTVTVRDDDSAIVTLSATTDGDENKGAAAIDGVFTVNISKLSDTPTVISYAIVAPTTADEGDDFANLSGSVTIPAMSSSATIDIPVLDDSLAEDTETLTLQLTGISSGDADIMANSGPATIDILDDDAPTFTINDAGITEGDSGSKNLVFTVSLSSPVDKAIVVDVHYGGGTATPGLDYDASPDQLVFPIFNTTSQTVTVPVYGEQLVELDEWFTASLSTPTDLEGRTVDLDDTGSGTIVNNDTATFTISDATVREGTGSPLSGPFPVMTFNISVDNPIDIDTVIDVDFLDGTAVGGNFDAYLNASPDPLPLPSLVSGIDYDTDPDNSSSVQTLPANISGANVLSVSVRVNPDAIAEGGTLDELYGSERFTATLSDTTGARSTVASDTGTGTIQDDDAALVSLDATDPLAMEPANDGAFTVTQTLVSSSDTVIGYSIGGTADNGADYANLTGQVTISAGSTSAVLPVDVIDSLLLEDDETVVVSLTDFVSHDLDVTFGELLTDTVVIYDNDSATVSIAANLPNAAEPNTNGQFTVTMTEISDVDTVVAYTVATGVGQATAGADYNALSGQVTIPAFSTSATIDVGVLDDSLVENPETVTVTLTGFLSPTNADIAIGSPATDTVTIHDGPDGILVNVMPNGDGAEPSSNGSFQVYITRTDGVTPVPAPAGGLTVEYSTGGTAVGGAGGDYTALSGLIFLEEGSAAGLIDVNVQEDASVEGTETVNVTLEVLSRASFPTPLPPGTEPVWIGVALATIDILDNDAANTVPTADAGGPYTVGQGGAIVLDGSGSHDPNQDTASLDFLWDLDGDGIFGELGAAALQGDEIGMHPTFDATGLPGETARDIALRVVDLDGLDDLANAVVGLQGLNVEVDGVTSGYSYQSYSSQDVAPISAVVEDSGDTLRVQGNSWKRLALPYAITPNTVLEFDFESNVEGEIHGIGFDNNNTLNLGDDFFQIGGDQSWWGNQDFNDYVEDSGLKHYTIPVGKYFTGDATELVLVTDDDSSATAESVFSNLRIYEKLVTDEVNIEVNGTVSGYAWSSYSGQDVSPLAVQATDGGDTLSMTGNTWKKVDLPHVVTAETILEFDFSSNVEGEIHAIGFDSNNTLNVGDAFFQLDGTQSWWGGQDFNTYVTGSGATHYAIPVGEFMTGAVSELVFAMDDDANAIGESAFSNIRIYEACQLCELNVEVNGTNQSYSWSSYANQDTLPTSVTTENGGDTFRMVGNTWKKIDMAYNLTSNTVLEFDFASSIQGEIHAIGFDTNNSIALSDRFIQLHGTQSWWANQDYNNGSGHYVIPLGQVFSGSFTEVVFATDDDASASGESIFSNLKIYEL